MENSWLHNSQVDTSRLNYDGVPARQCMSQMLQNRQHSHCNPCHRPHNQYSYYHQPTTTSSAVCGNGPDGACCHGAGEFGNRLDHLAGRVTFPPDTLPCFGLTDVHVGGACKAVDHSQVCSYCFIFNFDLPSFEILKIYIFTCAAFDKQMWMQICASHCLPCIISSASLSDMV